MARTASYSPADAIQRAPNLYSLAQGAMQAGLEHLLELSLEGLLHEIDLSVDAYAALLEIEEQHLVETVGELILGAHPNHPEWRAPPAVVAELFDAIKAWLSDSLPPPVPGWASRSELESWADEHGLADALSTPLRHLDGVRPELTARLNRARAGSLTLADALFADSFRGARLHAALGARQLSELAGAAARHLRALASDLAATEEAIAAAQSNWPPPQLPPGLARAGELLLAELDHSRRQSPRLLPRSAIREFACDLRDGPPALGITMLAPRSKTGSQLQTVRVQLPLETAGASCSCAAARSGSCRHLPAAILLALDLLQEVESPLCRQVAELLSTPPWMRTLEAMDVALRDPEQEEPPEQRLAWRLTAGADGSIQVMPVVQSRRARGGWTKGSEPDWWEARQLASGDRDYRAYAVLNVSEFGVTPSPGAQARALLELCGHDAVVLASNPSRSIEVEKVDLAVRTLERADGAVELVVVFGGEELQPARLLAALRAQGNVGIVASLDEEAGRCRVAHLPSRLDRMLRALGSHTPRFPAEAVGSLLDRLQGLQEVAPVELAPALAGREISPESTVVLRLERQGATALEVKALVRPVPGGVALEPGIGSGLAVGLQEGERVCAQRDFEAEIANAQSALRSLVPGQEASDALGCVLHGDAALDLLVALAERQEDPALVIEWPRDRPRITRRAAAADVRAEVKEQRDWFGLGGGVEVEGISVDLALALDAVRRGSRYVEAEPGVFVSLADELRASLSGVAEQVYVGRNGVELAFAAAPAIEALVEEGAELHAARSFGDLLGRIRAARSFEAPLPQGLHAQLRPYQVEGFRWLARLAEWGAGGCLADDMGLGKTLQSLALLLHRAEAGPALVVAPTSVCGNWVREAERFAPGLRVVLYGSLDGAEREALQPGPGELVVISYGLLSREIDRLSGWSFATAIFDEAQALKNPQTERARAARRIEAEVRLALSGTPLENHLGELWSLYRVVLPGLLGSSEQFRERFALPIERGVPGRREALARVLRPFLLRRTKAQVASDLPSRTEIDVPVTLSAAERRLYDEARLAAAARVAGMDGSIPPERRRFEVLAALTRLRLCACHPRLYDEKSDLPSAKLTQLVATLEELRDEGHRALVFSQFTRHLDLVGDALGGAGISCLRLDGSTTAARRQPLVDRWQGGEGDAFLISLKAGGTGLNLTGADYVIHLDPWWNPAAEDQATDRAHRIGQTRPVTVLRLVAKGTIEEQILALHAEKRELLASVLDGADGGVRVDTEALVALLEQGGDATVQEEDESVSEVPELFHVPACLGTEDPEDLPGQLRRFLEAKHDAGQIGAGPVRNYPRAMARFADFVAAGRLAQLRDAPLETVRDHYLQALRSRSWAAPQSEPALARAAFGQLVEMIEKARSGGMNAVSLSGRSCAQSLSGAPSGK